MSTIYPMERTFSEALLKAIGGNGPSLKAVAEGAGVSYEQLKKVKQGKSKSTNVEDAIKIAGFFGTSVEEFINDPKAAMRTELAELVSGLHPEELVIVLAAARGISARDRAPSE
jgi:transcriptional regulator with XRE-family HTH domain